MKMMVLTCRVHLTHTGYNFILKMNSHILSSKIPHGFSAGAFSVKESYKVDTVLKLWQRSCPNLIYVLGDDALIS